MAYVHSIFIKEILMRLDNDGKRGRWIAEILEYGLEIKPTKVVKGQGLEKLLTYGNCKALGFHDILNNSTGDEF